MDQLLTDVRFGIRSLLKSPGLAIAALVTLALGIGATTAVYSILNHVILHPLPFKGEDRLVLLYEFEPGPNMYMTPGSDVVDRLRTTTHAFDAVEMIGDRYLQSRPPNPANVSMGVITSSLLATLGLAPALGRPFLPSDEAPGSAPVVMLGYGYWQREFGGRSDVMGRALTLNDTAYTIVGVAPRALEYLATDDVWAPLQVGPDGFSAGLGTMYDALARLRPGATVGQGRQELQRAYDDAVAGYAGQVKMRAEVRRPGAFLGDATKSGLAIIAGAVALVLLIACANVAGLLTVRGISREHELGVRATLGASRGRLVRQLLVEHALLGLLGGVLALPVAEAVLRALHSTQPGGRLSSLSLVVVDGTALRAAAVVTMAAVALFGVLPAFRATRERHHDALKARGTTSTRTRARFHYALVTGEVALAVVIVVAATLLVQSYRRLLDSDPGFKAAGLVGARVTLPASRYPADAGRAEVWRELVARVAALPGVEGATTAGYLPPDFGIVVGRRIDVTGADPSEGVRSTPYTMGQEGPSYFSVLEIPIVEGRGFTADDERGGNNIVINQAMAKSLWPGTSAVGNRLRTDPTSPWRTVVGVCGNIAEAGLLLGKSTNWFAYEPPSGDHVPRGRWLVVRVGNLANAQAIESQLTSLVHSVDENLIVTKVSSASALLAGSLAMPRFSMALVTAFGFLALLLAAVGLYGVLSYAVQQRTREIGIRIALGAERNGVVRLAVGRGIRATTIGFLLGLLGSVAAFRVMRSALYGMSPWDPGAFVVVVGLLGVVAIAAAWVPARRATRVDPMVALRYE